MQLATPAPNVTEREVEAYAWCGAMHEQNSLPCAGLDQELVTAVERLTEVPFSDIPGIEKSWIQVAFADPDRDGPCPHCGNFRDISLQKRPVYPRTHPDMPDLLELRRREQREAEREEREEARAAQFAAFADRLSAGAAATAAAPEVAELRAQLDALEAEATDDQRQAAADSAAKAKAAAAVSRTRRAAKVS